MGKLPRDRAAKSRRVKIRVVVAPEACDVSEWLKTLPGACYVQLRLFDLVAMVEQKYGDGYVDGQARAMVE